MRSDSSFLAAGLLAGLLLTGPLPAARAGEAPPTAPVLAVESPDRLEIDGVVEAVRQATIAAQVAGAVTAVEVQAGDAVRAGQVLLRLDGADAGQAREAARALAGEARAELALAQAEYARRKALYEQRYVSRAAYDQARARLAAARAQADAREAQARAAEARSGHFTVLAPHDGLLGRLDAHLGDMVMPGQPLAVLFDPGALRIRAEVPQRFIGRLAPRARAAGPADVPAPPEGLPVQVLPARDAASLTGTVRLALPPGARGPAPGSPVRIAFELRDTARTRLWIPTRAIVRRTGVAGVYVLGADGAARLRQVRPGPEAGDATEILAGLDAGERVVLDPGRIRPAE
ncbi:efflux transporter, RND family, MFP subunit, putative [Castellaniella defragrans 65Phen]|uniref:Efflux transporter, RND family, MFP subunit, putative n=1 Tax=Castellaniella defragrans (strain DSM 12143 / CCUG 39792 / 65Phen) TaxID=1437824 RepID=W8X424_CASD6|nr:efflux RND transporter periplasmic adaptor subunit [Castellaniella defragrans]CDM24126.1 efflux transporter, RND family, MFP subunit, putative [Castellaniella defragrans 65Phen]